MDNSDKPKHKLTRWQVRVDEKLEAKIRKLSIDGRRSINQTIILIIEKYLSDQEEEGN